MIDRRLAVPVLLGSLLLAGCRKEPPPPAAAPAPAPTAAAPTPAPPAGPNLDSIARAQALAQARANLEETIFFDYDMSAIRSDAEAALRRKIPVLQASPAVRMRIEGHADERGSTEYNLALGMRRAESVRAFMVGFGLPADRFTILSYGEERPRAQGSTEAAWSQNRRAEFVITDGANQIQLPATNR